MIVLNTKKYTIKIWLSFHRLTRKQQLHYILFPIYFDFSGNNKFIRILILCINITKEFENGNRR
jgi:hypothetical protein